MLHPIKQGLKHKNQKNLDNCLLVAMLHPIKQGLKPYNCPMRSLIIYGCYATSNKTRIETRSSTS